MDVKQKKLISNLLLSVGVIFILIAGSVFVATAWKYIPLFVKQLALLGVSFGMFTGSVVSSKNEKLVIVEHALFYLGTAFVGFFVMAIMGGILNQNFTENAFRMMIANGAMLIPVIAKLLVKKQNLERVMLTFLADSILFSACIAFEASVCVYLTILAGVVSVFSVLDAVDQENNLNGTTCISILYLFHLICYIPFLMMYVLAEGTDIVSCIGVAVLVVISLISWKSRGEEGIRICNSFAIVWFIVVSVLTECELVNYDGEYEFVWLMIAIIVSVLMVVIRRIEFVIMLAIAAGAIPYLQLFICVIDYFGSSVLDVIGITEQSDWSCTYYPYSIVFMLGFLAYYIMKYGLEEMIENWTEKAIWKLTAFQFVNVISLLLASTMETSFGMVFFLLIAMDMLAVMVVMKKDMIKKVFGTMAMFMGIMSVVLQPFLVIPETFIVEWVCLFGAISIVLFRMIWYDKKEEFSILYFTGTCILLATLLMRNLISGQLMNVLILGLTGIIMLIMAAGYNNRKYVIASSVTLVLLVFYLTKDFWMSIAWWVYLFVAGVVLVLLAIRKAKES